jgi:hypothetical protein
MFDDAVKEQLRILPDALKQAVLKETYQKDLDEILQKNNVTDSEGKQELTIETILVLTGLQSVAQFYENISSSVAFKEQGSVVAQQVIETVFTPLRTAFEALQKTLMGQTPLGKQILAHDDIRERYYKLPANVQTLLLDVSDDVFAPHADNIPAPVYEEMLQRICSVAIGLSPATEFQDFIQNKLELSGNEASELESVVHNNIFTPIKQALLKALEGNTPNQGGGNTPPISGTIEPSGGTTDPYTEAR